MAAEIYNDWAQVLGSLLVTRHAVCSCPQKVAFSSVRGVNWEIEGQLLDTPVCPSGKPLFIHRGALSTHEELGIVLDSWEHAEIWAQL